MLRALIRTSSAYFGYAHRFLHSATASLAKETGLYGFAHLKTPKGFQRMVDDAIERSNDLVNYIAGMPSGPQIIQAMDEISDTVCTVIDSAELCRHTHPDREYAEEANKASLRLNEYLHYLNSNPSLYHAIIKAEKDPDMLSEEALRAAHHLRIDLEKGGIHLSPEKLDRVNQLNIDILQLCREFNENIINDPGHVDIFPASRIPKNLHHLTKPIYRPSTFTSKRSMGSDCNSKERGLRLVTEPNALCSILQLASDAEVRRLAYIKGNSAPRANLVVLDKLLSARHEFSEIMGCKSYAEFALKENMASSPEVVLSFLHEMSKMVRPMAEEEFRKILDFKRGRSGDLVQDLEAWDEAYFTRMMKSSVYNLDYSVVSSYFTLPQCIEGLKVLAESLFGVKFHEIPLCPGESWHPDVLKLSLHHPDEGDLGYLYLDLKSRKGKHPICAHFAIKGGRRISETDYQLPIVALVCNFTGSNFTSVHLHHSDVETLFHEFGHALHSLLSRTDYQHFSGTRVVLDLAETPSNLFEYFAWDYRVLRTFAKHYSTGDPIPEKLVKSLLGAKHMFAATELQRQIFYALIDQALHTLQPSSVEDTISVVADLKREHTTWNHVEGTHWHTRFSHLVTYGAGYYSYLYAKCLAATIWQRLFQEDPLSLSAGTALKSKFLQHGGAKDPTIILTDLVGNCVRRKLNGGIIPDITSLGEEMKLLK
ncbi:Metalloendopeptidase family - mitochondrial intermediate peptidase [Handroanthus impetiginosus]|uniref:Metalloendopeptidase family-mitochondrial intermediate peptidase n=1 Tax=Handroanthus impetiginosus TaxID=429701 RepID=A0A2G9GN32_9LAMI|nr:Metalloendopeptidase family - mitochondrial intermediate peptidase [Handroanthus impetiginosus]